MISSFSELARQRRSVRKYRPDPVPRELIKTFMEDTRLAPSACNSQPWSFVVADRDPLRARLADAAFSGVYSMNRFAAAAPVLVAVLTERSKFMAAMAGMFRGVQYNLVDIGIACAFLSLAAEERGLGSCMLGWFDEKAVKTVLGLPSGARIDILISIGYSAEAGNAVKARKPPRETWRYAVE